MHYHIGWTPAHWLMCKPMNPIEIYTCHSLRPPQIRPVSARLQSASDGTIQP